MSFSKGVLENQFDYGAEMTPVEFAQELIKALPIPTPRRGPRITNNLNLPEPLAAAVRNDKYDKGKSDYTTSQLAGTPARVFALKLTHGHELTEDVADRIYSLSGQSKHVILERAAEFCEEYEYLAEKRFYIKRLGKTIGGQIDLYDSKTKTLYDWKEVSVWVATDALKNPDDLKPEWIAQGNINKLLADENGYPVERLINIALYRDWKKSIALTKRADEYPPHQVGQFPLPMWEKEQTERFLESRITEFERAKVILPECSDEERWLSGNVYALMKKGQKKAVKLFDTAQEARSHIEIFNLKGHEIKYRPGVNKRCESYCICAPVCTQYQQIKKEQEDEITRSA